MFGGLGAIGVVTREDCHSEVAGQDAPVHPGRGQATVLSPASAPVAGCGRRCTFAVGDATVVVGAADDVGAAEVVGPRTVVVGRGDVVVVGRTVVVVAGPTVVVVAGLVVVGPSVVVGRSVVVAAGMRPNVNALRSVRL